MPKSDLDPLDLRILDVLQRDARVANVDLAEQVGLSPSPCLRRVRAIEQAGVIDAYAALLDPAALGLDVTAFVEVTLERQSPDAVEVFETAMAARPEVMECYEVTGDHDYLLRVTVADIDRLRRFVMDDLLAIPSVARTRSNLALGRVKYTTALPLAAAR